jgi:hypothetical protein
MTAWPLRHSYQYGRDRAGASFTYASPSGGARTAPSPVVVHAPYDSGGRRVTLRGKQAGVARSVADVLELLRLAGVHLDAEEAAASPLIEWRGGGPDLWWSS